MKRIFSFILVLFIALNSFSQAQQGSVEYQKKMLSAAVIELPYPPAIVNAAMNDYLSKKGRSKGNDMKGFTTYRNTQMAQNDSGNADLYFKTERKSRKEKQVTVISLVLMATNEQAYSNNLNYLSVEEGKAFLNDLAIAIEAYSLELTIKDQNDALAKAEAKYKSLRNDAADLEQKRNAIENKIKENNNDQQLQLQEVENQKQKLAQMVNQRKA